MPTARLQIRLLGDFVLQVDDDLVTAAATPRLQSLLAYLVLHRDAPQPRNRLAFLLWPDRPEAQALTNLRNLVFQLRRALPDGAQWLRAEGRTLQWNPDVPLALDVAAFVDAIRAAEAAEQAGRADDALRAWREAVESYRGELLPSCYDEWILPEREWLHNSYLSATVRLVKRLEEQRAYAAAAGYLQRLLRFDPLDEAAYRDLIRLHALDGDRAAALHTYHACATTLERELGLAPSPATRELYERLVQAPDAPALPPDGRAATAPLVGRQTEWAQLRAAWQQALAGAPQLVLLTGEAGIGKSRLAEELREWINRQGIPTAAARCYAAEGGLAYGPLVTWLRARPLPPLEPIWRAEIGRLLPEIHAREPGLPPAGPLTEAWQRRRLFDALARALLGSRAQPLLLVLDDVQWCDPETLAFLPYLLRYDPAARLLLVLTLRPGETSLGATAAQTALDDLCATSRRDGRLLEVALPPLAPADSSALAQAVAGRAWSAPALADLYAETEGNPLFVVEMVRAGAALPAAGRALPPTVQAVIQARLARLSPPARDVAAWAAVLGRDFTFDVLLQASAIAEEALITALDELWRGKVIREQGEDRYDFSHARLRDAAYAGQSAARRRVRHRRAAAALEAIYAAALDAVGGQIAAHYEQAGAWAPAFAYYVRAADAARRVFANDEAIRQYRRALAVAETAAGRIAPARAGALHEPLGDLLALTARHQDARESFEQGLAGAAAPSPLARARLLRKIGTTWRAQGRHGDALRFYAAAEAALALPPDSLDAERRRAWCDVQFEIAQLYYDRGDVAALERLLAAVRPVVERVGAPPHHDKLFQTRSQLSFRRNRYVVSADDLADERAALARAEQAGDAIAIGVAHFHLGFRYLWYGDIAAAEAHMHTALGMARQIGDQDQQQLCLTYLAVVSRKRGRAGETRRFAEEAFTLAARDDGRSYMGAAAANLSWVAWHAGDWAGATAHGAEALRLWEVGKYPFAWLAVFPLAAAALAQGQPVEAVAHLRRLLSPVQQRLPAALDAAVTACAAAADAGRAEDAARLAEQAVALGRDLGYL